MTFSEDYKMKNICFAHLLKWHIRKSTKRRITLQFGGRIIFHGATNPTVSQVFNIKMLSLFHSVSKECVYCVNSF